MMRHLQSLRGLTIAFLCLFLTVTTLAGLGTFFATLSMINHLVDHRIESESHALAPPGSAPDRLALRRRIMAMASQRDTGDLGLLLTDAQGRRIAGNAIFARALPLGFSTLGGHDRIEGLSAGRIFVREIGGGMRLAIFAETEPIDDYFAARRAIYLSGFGAIVLVVLAGLLLFRRLIGARIEQMRVTAEAIVEGDLAHRVPVVGDGGEFDRQAAAFNHMLDRVSMLMAEIRNVSNNVSHEMRTPLARLRNALSLLEHRAEAAPIRDELAQATTQADALLAMFSAMLRIAEIDSGSRRAGFQALELDRLVADMVDMIAPLADEGGHEVRVMRCDPVVLTGDRQLLSQLLLNLLENAVRHTPDGTQVRVSVEAGLGRILLTVEDDGPGVPADQRALVMRRFGRVDQAGERKGHGLGLPLAAAIVRLHRGTLTLEDAGGGLRITVMLPQ